jgi:hypothetical protein
MIQMAVTGQAEVMRRMKEVAKLYPKAMAGAIYKLGVAIMSNALPRVPVEFGQLRASHYVAPPQGQGAKANVELGFGTVYAVPQHERLDYKHPRGGEAKYLEKAIYALSPAALQLLMKWASEIAKNGGSWGRDGAMPARPKVGNSNRKSKSQGSRLKRAAANVRRRTGR